MHVEDCKQQAARLMNKAEVSGNTARRAVLAQRLFVEVDTKFRQLGKLTYSLN